MNKKMIFKHPTTLSESLNILHNIYPLKDSSDIILKIELLLFKGIIKDLSSISLVTSNQKWKEDIEKYFRYGNEKEITRNIIFVELSEKEIQDNLINIKEFLNVRLERADLKINEVYVTLPTKIKELPNGDLECSMLEDYEEPDLFNLTIYNQISELLQRADKSFSKYFLWNFKTNPLTLSYRQKAIYNEEKSLYDIETLRLSLEEETDIEKIKTTLRNIAKHKVINSKRRSIIMKTEEPEKILKIRDTFLNVSFDTSSGTYEEVIDYLYDEYCNPNSTKNLLSIFKALELEHNMKPKEIVELFKQICKKIIISEECFYSQVSTNSIVDRTEGINLILLAYLGLNGINLICENLTCEKEINTMKVRLYRRDYLSLPEKNLFIQNNMLNKEVMLFDDDYLISYPNYLKFEEMNDFQEDLENLKFLNVGIINKLNKLELKELVFDGCFTENLQEYTNLELRDALALLRLNIFNQLREQNEKITQLDLNNGLEELLNKITYAFVIEEKMAISLKNIAFLTTPNGEIYATLRKETENEILYHKLIVGEYYWLDRELTDISDILYKDAINKKRKSYEDCKREFNLIDLKFLPPSRIYLTKLEKAVINEFFERDVTSEEFNLYLSTYDLINFSKSNNLSVKEVEENLYKNKNSEKYKDVIEQYMKYLTVDKEELEYSKKLLEQLAEDTLKTVDLKCSFYGKLYI